MPKRDPILLGEDGNHYPRLIAKNGEILAVGEGYESRAGAESGLRAMVRAALRLAPDLIEEGEDAP